MIPAAECSLSMPEIFYLVGIIAWVSPDTATETIVFGQIEDEFKTETHYSHTYAINLKDYLPQISEITGVSIPEPADYAFVKLH